MGLAIFRENKTKSASLTKSTWTGKSLANWVWDISTDLLWCLHKSPNTYWSDLGQNVKFLQTVWHCLVPESLTITFWGIFELIVVSRFLLSRA